MTILMKDSVKADDLYALKMWVGITQLLKPNCRHGKRLSATIRTF